MHITKEADFSNISINVKNAKDMFEQFGYRSNNGCTLKNEFERFIFNSIRNYPLNKKLRLLIQVQNSKNEANTGELEEIIHTHFYYRAKEADLFLKQQFKQWVINMVIGILFLILCLILVEVLNPFTYINFVNIVKESLLIIGWVALWEPVTFILFGWRSIKANTLYYRKICTTPIIATNFMEKL